MSIQREKKTHRMEKFGHGREHGMAYLLLVSVDEERYDSKILCHVVGLSDFSYSDIRLWERLDESGIRKTKEKM